jgi:hypothetical protein
MLLPSLFVTMTYKVFGKVNILLFIFNCFFSKSAPWTFSYLVVANESFWNALAYTFALSW